MKRFFLLLFVILMLMGLVGCSEKTGKDENETSVTVASTTVSDKSDSVADPSEVKGTQPQSQGSSNAVNVPSNEKNPTGAAVEVNPTETAKTEKKEWTLFVKGIQVMGFLPMYEGHDLPGLPLLAIGKMFGAEVEWLTDTELSLWYGENELYINTEYENFCIYLPYGEENPIREMVGEEVYVDLPSVSSAISRWEGTSVSVDSTNKVIRIY